MKRGWLQKVFDEVNAATKDWPQRKKSWEKPAAKEAVKGPGVPAKEEAVEDAEAPKKPDHKWSRGACPRCGYKQKIEVMVWFEKGPPPCAGCGTPLVPDKYVAGRLDRPVKEIVKARKRHCKNCGIELCSFNTLPLCFQCDRAGVKIGRGKKRGKPNAKKRAVPGRAGTRAGAGVHRLADPPPVVVAERQDERCGVGVQVGADGR